MIDGKNTKVNFHTHIAVFFVALPLLCIDRKLIPVAAECLSVEYVSCFILTHCDDNDNDEVTKNRLFCLFDHFYRNDLFEWKKCQSFYT